MYRPPTANRTFPVGCRINPENVSASVTLFSDRSVQIILCLFASTAIFSFHQIRPRSLPYFLTFNSYRYFAGFPHPIMRFKVVDIFDCPQCAHSSEFIFHYHVLSAIMAASPVCQRVPPDND
ncbi:hypothetical protein S532_001773 [Salmonella enterica subsp. enterica]|nr:hypothetical protein [Salmonella enterica]EDQ2735876.1 hypothetical protein [Salmonella enterica subsp. enterica]EDT3126445.1 hypothetical protein [Salmonella enterica subsp. enterica]EDW5115482.1 hypothetical protein [Salmonella enterica subsp. enterica serovar Irumu]EDX3295608.1 hypothetical protein [Salmonella enterica subsp. enterica serovar Irumu]